MNTKIVVKGYQVLNKMAEQGMRISYRALHLKSGQKVILNTIKVRPGKTQDLLMVRAKQSKKCLIANLVKAIDYGICHEDCFYYTELENPKRPLRELLEEPMSSNRRLFQFIYWFKETLKVVDYLHQANTTHRNLSMNNLYVDYSQELVLDGFINPRPRFEAKSTTLLVDQPYLAPELLIGNCYSDRKTDVFSLGVIFFEGIVGKLPYSSNFAKLEAFKLGEVPLFSNWKLDIPQELQLMINKSLGLRNQRYQNLQEWLEELENFYSTRSLGLKLGDLSRSFKNLVSFK